MRSAQTTEPTPRATRQPRRTVRPATGAGRPAAPGVPAPARSGDRGCRPSSGQTPDHMPHGPIDSTAQADRAAAREAGAGRLG